MTNDLFEKTLHEGTRALRCPRQIDVVEAVMEQVLRQPVPLSTNTNNKKKPLMRYLTGGGSIAACAALAVGFFLYITGPQRHDEQHIGLLMSDVSSYVTGYAANNDHYLEQFAGIEQIFLDYYLENEE